ncbi:MAG: hypothetical protein JWM88_1227 [Verrucomicrobia bacterium]|nr:hypothetical protein [Verrucomicrobiota bacterium]
MTSVRVIRFARAAAPAHPEIAGAWIATVLLNEEAGAVGVIMRRPPGWEYVLAGGKSSGLASCASRQDLEHQIMLYYFGALPATGPAVPAPPLKLAV